MSKDYFYDCISNVKDKINQLPDSSHIKRSFTDHRIKKILEKIDTNDYKNLEWGYWQPFYLFLKNTELSAINDLDRDISLIIENTKNNLKIKQLDFLNDCKEGGSAWMSGLFETFIKASICKSKYITDPKLDFDLPNNRNIDVKAKIQGRDFYLECTTLGDSNADKAAWNEHSGNLANDRNTIFVQSQDAYTQGRRLYDKVYEKIARSFDVQKSQFSSDSPNLLAIGLSSTLGDISPDSLSINWALDELFSSQPTENKSDISLRSWLKHKCNKNSQIDSLLAAPRQLSGILLFSGFKLENSRINYNADNYARISHYEMAIFEKALSNRPTYA